MKKQPPPESIIQKYDNLSTDRPHFCVAGKNWGRKNGASEIKDVATSQKFIQRAVDRTWDL